MSASNGSIAVHAAPAWRDRSDFIISAALSQNDSGRTLEQLWARRLSSNTFEICCVPFFLYDLSLGDVVSTTTDGEFVVDTVLLRSGRKVYRAWFGKSDYSQLAVEKEIVNRGGLVERSSDNLIAIDSVDTLTAQSVAQYLTALHDAGELVFEIGAE